MKRTPKDTDMRVAENIRVARKTWRMRLEGDTTPLSRPGQFVNIRLDDKYLRRPISVADYGQGWITLYYDVVGEGTEEMSRIYTGKLRVLVGLGNGFDTGRSGDSPLLIAGGIGSAPMLGLARKLTEEGKKVTAILGYNTAADIVMRKELEELGVEVVVSTADGSEGIKGFVTDAFRQLSEEGREFSYYYACGPMPMLRAVGTGIKLPGELSLDERMGCGYGACMCCSIQTRSGAKRICKDGPVFQNTELIW